MLSPRGHADDVIGDLEEAHRSRLQRHGRVAAGLLTVVETLDMAAALVRARVASPRIHRENGLVQDYKLGLRMLVKYPGLTLAGGLALALAIGIGAGWYDLSRDFLEPRLPFPESDRIVEVEMRNPVASGDERRLLHDFVLWRQHARLLEDLGAYRTIERQLVVGSGDARPEPVTGAEISASAFRVTRVPPLLGRHLLDSDEQPGAPPVVVIGYDLWRRKFAGRQDVIGQTLQLGRATTTTIVGVMPEGFTFPINHRLWVPLQLRPSGYAPLEGAPIRVFARVAPGATQAQAYAEVTALTERVAAASPQTHKYLRPRVLRYGGENPGDRSLFLTLLTHLPVLLVLIVACANVGTLVYARTATRDAEIATRYALGASRRRIVTQLFIEALVLSSAAAIVGLAAAHWAMKWGMNAYYAGQTMPFWVNPGLKLPTVLYALVLTTTAAAILGVLPALKATGAHAHAQLKNLGAGGSTLRFGWVWTSVLIGQVALTVICIPPALGIADEALRDRRIRGAFPAERYLAAQIDLDRVAALATPANEADAAHEVRLEQVYRELERRVSQEPGVVAVTFADRLPGMGVALGNGEVEPSPATPPVQIPTLWLASVGQGFFETFEIPMLAGRDFHDGDRAAGARTVLVNEAFARRYLDGANPVGRRFRFVAATPETAEPWLEIVGMVRDVGMTPTDLGEAPYVFRPASPATTRPLVMGVRVSGDPAALAPAVRAIAMDLDVTLRPDDLRVLDDLVWRVDVPMVVVASTIASVVLLGLFLSAAGIFALMSVSVARRTREIGLRAALGATPGRLLGNIFRRALMLVGSGIAAGNGVLLLLAWLSPELDVAPIVGALLTTSAVMLTVGLVACAEPARRALRIQPTAALKEM